MKTTMKFAVTGQRIELTEPVMLVAGTVNIYTAAFVFDSAWDGYTKTAVFRGGDVEREQLLTDDACTFPWEVLTPGKYLRVGVYGTKDDIRLPTIWTERTQHINSGAGPTDEAAEPSPALVEQLTAKVGNLDALETEDKSSVVAAINEVKETGGGGGTSDHSKLKNRDADDQHPMSAITGLVDALGGKQPVGSYITEESDPTVPEWAKQPQKPAYTAQEVGALPATTAIPSTAADVNAEPSGAVSQHNVSDAAHSDIRLLIQGLSERLSAVADSDDTTLDQLSEIVAYIKSNRDLIDAVTTSKVSVTDIVNDLVTNVVNKPLSAAQGVALKALIDAITIPTALPNPNALTFTGAAAGSYDGSAPLTVEIPSGGGRTLALIADVTTSEETNMISIDKDLNGNAFTIRYYALRITIPAHTRSERATFYARSITYGGGLTFTNMLVTDGKEIGFFVYPIASYDALDLLDGSYPVKVQSISSRGANVHESAIGFSSEVNLVQVYTNSTTVLFPAGVNVQVYGVRK